MLINILWTYLMTSSNRFNVYVTILTVYILNENKNKNKLQRNCTEREYSKNDFYSFHLITMLFL